MKKKIFQIAGDKKQPHFELGLNTAKAGFSLIEVLFSLLILSVGIVSILMIMTNNIKTYVTAKDQIIAAQFMQEGIELVRNLSDNDDTRFEDGHDYDNYRIEKDIYGDINFVSDSDNSDKKIYLDKTAKLYSHDSAGEPTKYARRIDINGGGNITDGWNREITVTVSWGDSNVFPPDCNVSNKCATSTSTLFYQN